MPDLTPDVTTTPNFDPGRVAIASGWLVYDVGYHTCGGYGPESGYAHEPGCGAEPICKVADIPDILAAAAERDALAAKVAALADWHETKAEKARRFRIEIDGRNPVMDKAAEVHTDAARRLRAALDEEPQP